MLHFPINKQPVCMAKSWSEASDSIQITQSTDQLLTKAVNSFLCINSTGLCLHICNLFKHLYSHPFITISGWLPIKNQNCESRLWIQDQGLSVYFPPFFFFFFGPFNHNIDYEGSQCCFFVHKNENHHHHQQQFSVQIHSVPLLMDGLLVILSSPMW